MLSSISLSNFKAARKLEIPLKALTLLSGLNGSGKSSVLQAIALIRQSYQHGKSGGLELGGPLVPLGKGADVLSESATDDVISIEILEEGRSYAWVCHAFSDASLLPYMRAPSEVQSFISSPNFQYLQADRIVPSTLYPQADPYAGSTGFLGNHGEFTIDYLSSHAGDSVSERRRVSQDGKTTPLLSQIAATNSLLDQVAGWLQEISPGVHLQADRLKGTDNVILQFRYLGMTRGRSRAHRPTHVGFGITYGLPILVACLAAQPGSLLLLENPEAHLHPHGQAKLGELLALCAADGVQIILETHSDHVLNGIRLAVKRKAVAAEDLQLAFFTREVTTGECYVELPSVQADGQLSNWPGGFFDEWERSLDELLR